MPEQFRAPRGAADILPEDQPYWRWLRDTAVRVATSFGYGEISTPVFEHAGVFIRASAEGTDLIDKEVYSFEDRGGDALVLRPEGTAAICRAYLEHGMGSWPQPVRLFYFAPMFRYDRPQAGRYRVFNHFGIEAIGDGAPGIDAESLDLITSYYAALGLNDYALLLNSIGDGNCRPAYIEKLRAYYADKLDRMCGDCRRRYEVNPLRLLDCKNEPCQPFKADAPKIADNLCEPCAEHFAAVRSLLDELGIKYVLTPTLVRGLHYYTRTTFEIEPGPDGSLSAMTKSAVSIAGGGRYDGLIEELGGQPTPGIGFGTGLERLIINLKRQGSLPPETPGVDVFVAVMSFEAQLKSVALARNLRGVGLNVVMGAAGRSLRAQLRHANALGARYALVIGAEELANDSVSLRDLTTSEQERVPAADIASRLRR